MLRNILSAQSQSIYPAAITMVSTGGFLGFSGRLSGGRLLVSVAIALALLCLVCTLWGCRGFGLTWGGGGRSGPVPAGGASLLRGSSLSYSPLERYIDSEAAGGGASEGSAGSADPAISAVSAASAVTAGGGVAAAPGTADPAGGGVAAAPGTADPAGGGVVASAGVVVPILQLKTRDNEISTKWSRNLEDHILKNAKY
jgi:hypothetical protein